MIGNVLNGGWRKEHPPPPVVLMAKRRAPAALGCTSPFREGCLEGQTQPWPHLLCLLAGPTTPGPFWGGCNEKNSRRPCLGYGPPGSQLRVRATRWCVSRPLLACPVGIWEVTQDSQMWDRNICQPSGMEPLGLKPQG